MKLKQEDRVTIIGDRVMDQYGNVMINDDNNELNWQ